MRRLILLLGVVSMVAASCGGGGDASPPAGTAVPPSGVPLVVDTDLAVDSVMALLYLLGRPEVDVAAVTVSGTGEVRCGPGAEIAAGLVALAGAEGVPVACGPSEPLSGSNAFPADWRSAADEAWGLDLPAGEAPSELDAPELLVSVVSSSDQPVVVFTEGPLTNLAAALRLDPTIAGGIAMVYVMGGAVDVGGNTPVNPDAEYNIWVDPTAAAEVFASGVPVTLVPLDATNQVPLEARHLRALEQHTATPAAAAALAMLQPSEDLDVYFWDQLAASILVDESLAGFETVALTVRTEGGPDAAGVTQRGPDGSEVRMAVTVDAARFEREFLSSLAGEDVGPIATPPKRPMGTVEELVTSLLAAADAGRADAWAALCTDEAPQSTYLVAETTGRLMEPSLMAEWDPAADPMPEMEVIGDPLVVGDAAAVKVRYSAPGEPARTGEGFVVVVGDRTADGVLVAGSASFVGMDEPAADAAVARELMEAQIAAWNADDVDGVLATMSDDVVVWGDILRPETMDSLPAPREMLAGALSLDMEMTGPPLTSGPFAAIPLRFTGATSEARRDVIATLWIRDGSIAMMAIAQGELSG